ncbi:MAG TPA: adenylyl-sulfate kinase [Methanocella sp.]|uniref:adenylyl-sulfate kinase n=1 Tax=Methanocella sp. TaxID=2052833 RepID=UPI002D0EECFF|nr:adenylyl-sulfate kinase [Methanocella sp.]HTY91778.1 adenylyl-sulfate kinase [Methanocella sp.]
MAWAVWVTGLPGSGKTTVTRVMADILRAQGVHVKVLNIDDVRKVLTPQPAYSLEERAIVYAAIAYMAKLLVDEGVNVIVDATGNLRKYRDVARTLIPDYAEIYVKCPLDLAVKREEARGGGNAPKDIYKKGTTGRSSTVPGVNVAYEPPEAPIVTLDTEKLPANEAGALGADVLLAHFGGTHV